MDDKPQSQPSSDVCQRCSREGLRLLLAPMIPEPEVALHFFQMMKGCSGVFDRALQDMQRTCGGEAALASLFSGSATRQQQQAASAALVNHREPMRRAMLSQLNLEGLCGYYAVDLSGAWLAAIGTAAGLGGWLVAYQQLKFGYRRAPSWDEVQRTLPPALRKMSSASTPSSAAASSPAAA